MFLFWLLELRASMFSLIASIRILVYWVDYRVLSR